MWRCKRAKKRPPPQAKYRETIRRLDDQNEPTSTQEIGLAKARQGRSLMGVVKTRRLNQGTSWTRRTVVDWEEGRCCRGKKLSAASPSSPCGQEKPAKVDGCGLLDDDGRGRHSIPSSCSVCSRQDTPGPWRSNHESWTLEPC